MSAATAIEASPPPKGKKKLIVIIAAVLVVLLAGGGGAIYVMKKNAAAAAEAEAEADAGDGEADHSKPAKKGSAKRDPKAIPVFVPLDPFTVNLADRNSDRYAQVAVTLEVEDAATEMQLKGFMPIIRNNILLAISERTAPELLARDGKEKLAQRIMRETGRAMGYDVPPEDPEPANDGAADDEVPKQKKPKRKTASVALPVRGVHFSSFIIQ